MYWLFKRWKLEFSAISVNNTNKNKYLSDTLRVPDKRSRLSGLIADVSGNTLALVAAGLLPMAGIIGSGVDLSRAYLVKTRLQQACDAGVLAGRRAMGEGSYDAAALTQSNNFFDANFPVDYLDAQDRQFSPTSPSGSSSVVGSASVTLPTIIMKLFGNEDFDISVDCKAIVEVANSDITMVLDTTGSMKQTIDDGSGGTVTRLFALESAMKNFYKTLDDAASGTDTRIRYAMVPYTGTVNIGEELLKLNPTYLAGGTAGDTHAYNSRQAWYRYELIEDVTIPAGTTTISYEQIRFITDSHCSRFSNNQGSVNVYYRDHGNYYYWYDWEPSSSGYSEGQSASKAGDSNASYTFSRESFSNPYTCLRKVTRTTTSAETETQTTTQYTLDPTIAGATFSHWEHTKLNHSVHDYARSIERNSSGNYINSAAPTLTAKDGSTSRWAGCVEERDTVDSDSIAFDRASDSIEPYGSYDLDIDLAPESDATRWRPYWPEVSYFRDTDKSTQDFDDDTSSRLYYEHPYDGRKPQTSCPSQATLLAEMSKSEFDTYAESLVADGGTYHDIGMIWGARISSPTGIFASNVNDTPTNDAFVSRHLVFMTDGILDISGKLYSAYGLEQHDLNVGTGDETQASANHISRFQAVCEATKAKGIRVWVIAFATSLTTELTNCASPSSAFVSTDAASLNTTFNSIAQSVADLRLSQ